MSEFYSFQDLPEIFNKLKENLRLAVVYGGNKTGDGAVINVTRNTRSWKSYEQVAGDIQKALQESGFRNVVIFPDDMSLLDNLKKNSIQMVWLNTGGVQGYNPTAHAVAMLEMAGIPYVGHNPLNSGILDTKHVFKYMLKSFSIRTAPFMVWYRCPLNSSREQDITQLKKVFGDYAGPFIVKPTSGRASLNVHVAQNYAELWDAVDKVYEITRNHILIETYLGGREFCASLCGPVMKINNKFELGNRPSAFSYVERILDDDELIFTSMDTKAITTKRTRVMGGIDDEPIINQLEEICHLVYNQFSLETLVRVDFRADLEGNLYVLEANPKPDLKKPNEKITSLTCCGLAENGMDYVGLIESLLGDRINYLMGYRPESLAHIDNIFG